MNRFEDIGVDLNSGVRSMILWVSVDNSNVILSGWMRVKWTTRRLEVTTLEVEMIAIP